MLAQPITAPGTPSPVKMETSSRPALPHYPLSLPAQRAALTPPMSASCNEGVFALENAAEVPFSTSPTPSEPPSRRPYNRVASKSGFGFLARSSSPAAQISASTSLKRDTSSSSLHAKHSNMLPLASLCHRKSVLQSDMHASMNSATVSSFELAPSASAPAMSQSSGLDGARGLFHHRAHQHRADLSAGSNGPSTVNIVHRLAHSQLNGRRFSGTPIARSPKAFTSAVSNQLNDLPELLVRLEQCVATRNDVANRAHLTALASHLLGSRLPALLSHAPSALVTADAEPFFASHANSSESTGPSIASWLVNLNSQPLPTDAADEAAVAHEHTLAPSASLPSFTAATERRFHFRLSPHDAFAMLGGVRLLTSLILRDDLAILPPNSVSEVGGGPIRPTLVPNLAALRVISAALDLLRHVCIQVPSTTAELANDLPLLRQLFLLCSFKTTIANATALLEELLAARTKTFDLSLIPNVHQLISSLAFDDFTHFIKIIVLLVYDLEDHGVADAVRVSLDKEVRAVQRHSSMLAPVRQVDRNHALLLGNPDLLTRLVKVLDVGVNGALRELWLDTETARQAAAHRERMAQAAAAEAAASAAAVAATAATAAAVASNPFRPLPSVPAFASPADLAAMAASAAASPGPARISRPRRQPLLADSDYTPAQQVTVDQDFRLETWHRAVAGASALSFLRPSAHPVTHAPPCSHVTISTLAEVIFVFNLLLGSKRKADTQTRLAQLGLVPILCKAYSFMHWRPIPPTPAHSSNLNVDNTTVKVQYLRLLHGMADGIPDSRHHRLFFAQAELSQIRTIERLWRVQRGPEQFAKATFCREPVGLVKLMMHELCSNETLDASMKFQFVVAIESHIRGATSAERALLATSDFFQFLLDELLSPEFKTSSILQSLFDLLGELIRFCPVLLMQFSDLCTDEAFARLLHVISLHLVDANVFLRSIMMTISHYSQHHRTTAESDCTSYIPERCKFAAFFGDPANVMWLCAQLMLVISIDELSQENICCLNSALVIFVFAYREGQLASFVERLYAVCNLVNGDAAATFANFAQLLVFWKQHYLKRHRDLYQLAAGSRISVDDWMTVVNVVASFC
ncbi:hypothetical protein CAOG_01853 [Capsaspora owczarzaki ATCC 30864]|uniref:Uncharacterized protein n=1 Tax=Capsaspora owczarzaki (strain ATCC 30864) TaxID=595528 RepID=A0A0D2U604_CAPO3|nr:hypothetical protein CAOG_01853 [Capsaspora owczarzaki ATCC 30864]KJE90551.1 hypothetical protein CAOG_001853 [Capsaspora owczarzaki ATCC 30864]|eukprot:XP_004364721.1 hypothetical protein CAOG_01853 [Capsaspora owczarzaki ATCC 30864]